MEEKGFPVVVILTHYCYITIIIIIISIIIISIIITIIFMGYYLNDTLLYHLKPFTNLCPKYITMEDITIHYTLSLYSTFTTLSRLTLQDA